MTCPILASWLVRLVILVPFQLLRLSMATPSRWTPVTLSYFFFSSRRRHTRYIGDWSSDVCSSDLYHAGILEVAREHPGIVVFHDFALQDFFLGLAQAQGRIEVYLEEVAACHGYDATRAAAEALERGSTPTLLARPTDFPLNCRLARSAEGIIVHSEWGRARFAAIAPAIS